VDGCSIEDFEKDLKDNLYKIWNRMSAGSYFPSPVRAVEIPKSHGGGTRILGVPAVADRIAQTVAARRRGQPHARLRKPEPTALQSLTATLKVTEIRLIWAEVGPRLITALGMQSRKYVRSARTSMAGGAGRRRNSGRASILIC
jgi:hypothetical protein